MINLAQKVGQKFVNSVFDSVHNNYDKANDAMSLFLHRKWKKDFIKMLNIKNEDNILDLASGTGDIAKLLLQKTPNVTLCDINPEMLEMAKGKINGGEFIIADAQNLPFKNNTFNFTTCVFGIRNFQEIKKSIQEVHRVLCKGGVFAVMEFMPNADNYNFAYHSYIKHIVPKYDAIFKSNGSYSYLSQSILKFQTREQFAGILKKNGFKVLTPSFMSGAIGVFLCEKI